MSSPNRIGLYPGPFPKSQQVEENTRTGSVTHNTVEGSYSECLMARNIARMQGASQITFGDLGDGNWRVQFDFPTGENGYEPVPCPSVHELEINVAQVSIYRSLVLKSLGLTLANAAAVKRAVDGYSAGKFDPSPPATTPTPESAAETWLNSQTGNDNLSLDLFRQIAFNGLDDCIQYSTVYRRTITAANPMDVQASYTGVGQIWTSMEVSQWEGLSPTGFFQLPFGSQWLKSKPQVVMIANQKTQLVYTYTECLIASCLAYTAYGAAQLYSAL